MRFPLVSAALLVLGAAACSRQPAPEVAPTPTSEPRPAEPARPVEQPPAFDRSVCESTIATRVADLSRMINFDTDEYTVRAGDQAALDAKVEIMRAAAAVRLRVTGHADERYTEEYNLILGSRRAEAAKEYLVRRGIDAGRIETATLGETSPLDPASNESAWARNRRAEFQVIAGRESLASHIAGCR